MQTVDLRIKLQEYIKNGDDKLLKLMYAVAKEYNEDDDDIEYQFSEEDIRRFEQRRQNRLAGLSKTYNREEAKEAITGKRKLP